MPSRSARRHRLPVLTLPPYVVALAACQGGVVSRRQLAERDAREQEVRTWLHHRLLVAVHRGVYVLHTGRPTAHEREWAAVLYAAPAALWGTSALPGLRCARGGSTPTVHVGIDESRRVRETEGVAVHRVVDLEAQAHLATSPPRMRVEEAALDVAAIARDDLDAAAVLAEVVSARRTTPARLAAALEGRSRVCRRDWIDQVLGDLAAGTCSVLEQAFLRDVERAHGLPAAYRQVRASARGTVYRDVLYAGLGLVVELDGRWDHTDAAARDRDLDRDLLAAVDGLLTVRLGWGQVVGRPCATARTLGLLMQRRGWAGDVLRCPSCP